MVPTLTFLLALVLGMERVRNERSFYLRIFGVVLGCCGAVFATLGHTRETIHITGGDHGRPGTVQRAQANSGDSTLAGDIAILLQCFTLAMYMLMLKKLTSRYSPLFITTSLLCSGAITTSIIALGSVVAAGGVWPGFSTWHTTETFWAEVAYASFLASVQNYLLRTWAIQYIPTTTCSMYFSCDPIATALFAYIFLGESIHTVQIVGGFFVLTGMYLVIFFKDPESIEDTGVLEDLGDAKLENVVEAEEVESLLGASVFTGRIDKEA